MSHCLCSTFSEIFDVDWFISFLSKDVKIIKNLPRKGGKTLTPYTMRVPRKCSERCYQNRVVPVLLKRHVSFHFSSTSDCLCIFIPLLSFFLFCWGGWARRKSSFELLNYAFAFLNSVYCPVHEHNESLICLSLI